MKKPSKPVKPSKPHPVLADVVCPTTFIFCGQDGWFEEGEHERMGVAYEHARGEAEENDTDYPDEPKPAPQIYGAVSTTDIDDLLKKTGVKQAMLRIDFDEGYDYEPFISATVNLHRTPEELEAIRVFNRVSQEKYEADLLDYKDALETYEEQKAEYEIYEVEQKLKKLKSGR